MGQLTRTAVPQGTLASDERLRWLEARLVATGQVAIAEAAEQLCVSEMTIRRDLEELEARGVAKRVRGGAKAIGPQTFSERRSVHARSKGRIAAKLATLVPDTGAIAVDASTTVMRVASMLGGARDLMVLTNGPDTFTALQGQPGVNALLTGGALEARTGSLVGPLACRSAAQLTYQRFFCSAAALDSLIGASEATLAEAEVKRQFAAMAGEVVLAVDSSKLNIRAAAAALEWDRIDILVTDLDPDDKRLASFQRLATIL